VVVNEQNDKRSGLRFGFDSHARYALSGREHFDLRCHRGVQVFLDRRV